MSGHLRLEAAPLTRRQFTIGAALTGALMSMPRVKAVAAQQADLAGLGLPSLDITITADGFEGLPETLEAGRYLLNATAEDLPEGGAIAFLRPYGMSVEEFFAFLGGGAEPEASTMEEGSEEGGEEGPLPSFIYQSTFAGGVSASPGMPGMAVIDLTEGEWGVWGDDPTAPQAPAVLNVTGEFPADAPDPGGDVMITLVDFGIMAEGNLTAGDHIVRVENLGAQPHFIVVDKVPDGTTNEDIAALLDSFMTGTPVPDGLTEEDFTPGFYTPIQSISVVTWTRVTLEAGTYSAICWFPTAGIGDPHALHGMHTVFEVS